MKRVKTPKPTFTQWLMATGTVNAADLGRFRREWINFKAGLAPLSTYDNAPRTYAQFVARKYPRELIVYQSMRRLTQ